MKQEKTKVFVENMALSKCQLCGQEKKLIKAHIIPEFMYQDTYEDGKMLEFMGIDLNKADESKARYRYKGIYDASILCDDCDNGFLNKEFDDYASRILYGYDKQNLKISRYKQADGVAFLVANPVDYTKFKLFLLSLLWRASISKRPEFEQVNLGPHEEKIREMILNMDAKSIEDYPIVMFHYTLHSKEARSFISFFKKYKKDSCHYYGSLIGGIMYIYYMLSRCLEKGFLKMGIQPNNTLSIIHSPIQGMEWIVHYLKPKLK